MRKTTNAGVEEELRRSLEEKSAQVRDINHRLKNTLQMIVSLLNLQSRHAQQPGTFIALEEMQARVSTIAGVYDRLCASNDCSHVEMGGYISAMANDLAGQQGTGPGHVTLRAETVRLALHIEKAMPVALIANELISTSLKHAPQSRARELIIRLQLAADQEAELSIEKSGSDFSDSFDASAGSMGWQLISLLGRQLKGRLITDSGGRIAFRFPLTPV
jgi:two-component sensor histidine kinase